MERSAARTLLPETGFLRLWNILGDTRSDPPTPAIIPVSKSTWWAGVKSGQFPRPIKLGPRITAWRVEDIRKLISEGNLSRNNSSTETEGYADGMGKNHV